MLVNEINGIINYDKFSHSYDNLYLGITLLGHRVWWYDAAACVLYGLKYSHWQRLWTGWLPFWHLLCRMLY